MLNDHLFAHIHCHDRQHLGYIYSFRKKFEVNCKAVVTGDRIGEQTMGTSIFLHLLIDEHTFYNDVI